MTSERSESTHHPPSRVVFPAGSDSSLPLPPRHSPHTSPHRNGDTSRSSKPSVQQYLAPAPAKRGSAHDVFTERRRVRSANAATSPDSSPVNSPIAARAHFIGATNSRIRKNSGYRRTISNNVQSSKSRGKVTPGSPSMGSSSRTEPLQRKDSPEDDPHIQADLRKALQYKSRVEEQLKTRARGGLDMNTVSSPSSPSPSGPSINPFLAKVPPGLSESGIDRILQAELDFSPSVGQLVLHPVPTSTDDGSTLDWSGIASEDEKRERRWTMNISRKASKEKQSPLSRKGFIQKQESSYQDKLSTIKERSTSQTLRKAEIARDQLHRRYNILSVASTSSSRLNPVSAVRWYTNQEEITKRYIDEAEPLSWLRHLLHRRDGPPRPRSSWALSALIVDEYFRSTVDATFIHQQDIYNLSEAMTAAGDVDSHARELERLGSRPSSFASADANGLPRRSSEEFVSFQPFTYEESRRSSGGTNSNSFDAQIHRWRTSLSGFGPNRGNTTSDTASAVHLDASPASSSQTHPSIRQIPLVQGFIDHNRHHVPTDEPNQRVSSSRSRERQRPQSPLSSISGISRPGKAEKASNAIKHHSDSSAAEQDHHDSAPEHAKRLSSGLGLTRIGEDTIPDLTSDKDDSSRRDHKRSRFRLSLDMRTSQPRTSTEDFRKKLLPPLSITELRTDVHLGADGKPVLKSLSLPAGNNRSTTPSGGLMMTAATTNPSRVSLVHGRSSPTLLSKHRRKARTSLPGSLHSSKIVPAPKKPGDDVSESLRIVEYERKRELLDNLRGRNSRMKTLLQTTTKTIIDYDETQQKMAAQLGLNYSQLPSELLEVLRHDPASALGVTRREVGWRAVEEIHDRSLNQQRVLEAFAKSISIDVRPADIPEGGIYHSEVSQLTGLLKTLQNERGTVLSRVVELTELLREVKHVRDELKPEFDETGRHTASNYPELVRLEALLDELQSRRNALWKVGEMLLSFSLTFFAPFMKTFGRPIWDDLHDFLVIPLYRNDFSGEEHWYPLSFPRRSLTHWIRLILVAFAIPATLKSGFDLLVALLTEGYLLRVPSFIPTAFVYFVLSGVVSAYAGTIILLLFAFLCELAVVFWWIGWSLQIVK